VEQAAVLHTDEAESLRRIRVRWLRRLVHDFRGPLFAARGYTKMLLDESAGSVTDTQRRYLENVAGSLDQIARLAEILRQFPDEDSLHLQPVDAAEILRSVIAARCGDAAYRLAGSIANLRAMTSADRAKLASAMHILLGAVVEFAGTAGDVRLHASTEDEELTVRFSGARKTSAPAPSGDDLITSCDIIRLHGGVAHMDEGSDGFLHVTVRLPLVSPAPTPALVSAGAREGK
jgi:signal transduction histidine kinase